MCVIYLQLGLLQSVYGLAMFVFFVFRFKYTTSKQLTDMLYQNSFIDNAAKDKDTDDVDFDKEVEGITALFGLNDNDLGLEDLNTGEIDLDNVANIKPMF